MKEPSKWWKIAAFAFVLFNAGGAVLAFAMREQMHGELHLALLGLGYVGWVFLKAAEIRRQGNQPAEIANDRMEYLQQSVDAMAIELERMREQLGYQEKISAGRGEAPDNRPG